MLFVPILLLVVFNVVGAYKGLCECYDNTPTYTEIWDGHEDCTDPYDVATDTRIHHNITECLCYRRDLFLISQNWEYEWKMELGCVNLYKRRQNEIDQKPTPENICAEKPTDIVNPTHPAGFRYAVHRLVHYTAGVCCQGHRCNNPQTPVLTLTVLDVECSLGSYNYAPLMWSTPKKTAKCFACAVDFLQPKHIEADKRTWHDYRIAGECAFFWTCDNATKLPIEFRFGVEKDDYEFVFKKENSDFCSVDLQGNISKYLKSGFEGENIPANWAHIASKLINGLTCFFSKGKFTEADVNKLGTKSGCYFCSLHGKETSGKMSYKYDCHTDEKHLPNEGKQGDVTVKVCFEENSCNTPIRCSTGEQHLLTKSSTETAQCLLCGTQLMHEKTSNDREPYALKNLVTYGFCINEFTCPDEPAGVQVPEYESVGRGPVCFDGNPTADQLLQKLLKPSFSEQFSDGFQYPTGYSCYDTSQSGNETWWNGLVTANFTSIEVKGCGDCATVLWTPTATDIAPMYKLTCLRDVLCEQYADEQISHASYRNFSGVVNVTCCHSASPCHRPPELTPYIRQCFVTSADTGRVVLAVREGNRPPEFSPLTETELEEEAKLLAHEPCTLCTRLVFENGRSDLACLYSKEAGSASSVAEHDCTSDFDQNELKRRVRSRLVSAICSSDQFAPEQAVGLRCYLGDEFDRKIETTDKNGVPLKACAKLKKLGSQVTEYPAITTDTQCPEYEAKYRNGAGGVFRCCHSGPGSDSEPCNSLQAQNDSVPSHSNRFSCYTDETRIAKDCVACYVERAGGRILKLACFQKADMKGCTVAGHCCFGDRCNEPACFRALSRPCPTLWAHGAESSLSTSRFMDIQVLYFVSLRIFFL